MPGDGATMVGKRLADDVSVRRDSSTREEGIDGPIASANDKRSWTIKGIKRKTVDESRKAAEMNGMLLSLWVERQLREAADRELRNETSKSLGAEVLSTRIENIEAMLRQYIANQDKSIGKLQEELHTLSNKILPPLLEAIAVDRVRKRA